MTPTPVFGITGWKNSGKPQLVTRLVAEFTARSNTRTTISISTGRARTATGTGKPGPAKSRGFPDADGP